MSVWTELWRSIGESIAANMAKPKVAPGGVSGSVSKSVAWTGYVAPTPPAGIQESRDIAHCHPELQRRYAGFAADYKAATGRELYPTCTWRSDAKQLEYFRRGRVQDPGGTWRVVNKALVITNLERGGRHNKFPSQAVDVAIDFDPGPGKHLSWDAAAYEPFGRLALKHGLRWGGDWNRNGSSADERFVDRPHLELPAGVA